MGHIAAACHLGVQLVALQDLVQEVDVPGRQFEGLNLAQLVRGQRGDDLPQRGKRLVQRLRALALPHVGHDPLRLQLLVRLRAPASTAAAASTAARAAAAAAARRLLAALALGRAARLVATSDAPARGPAGPRATARAAPAAAPLASPALAARRLLPVRLLLAVAQAVVGRRDWRAGHLLHHLAGGDVRPRGAGKGGGGRAEKRGALARQLPRARRRPGRCGPEDAGRRDGGEPLRGGRWRRGGRRAGEGTVWRAPRSKKKAPDGRTRALLALAQPVPVLASPRGVWESGAGCGLGGSYTSVRAESLGGSGVIGLT